MAEVKYNIQNDLISISEGIDNQFEVDHASSTFDIAQVRAGTRTIFTKICVFIRSLWNNSKNNTGLSTTIAKELKRVKIALYKCRGHMK